MDPMNEAFFFFLWHTALDFFSGHHPTCLNTATLVVPIFGRISTPPPGTSLSFLLLTNVIK